MIRKVKNWLGIESVKVDMVLPPDLSFGAPLYKGVLVLSSLSEQKVMEATIQVIEKYERGRKEDKLINDFLIGEWKLNRSIEIPAKEKVFIPFKMPLHWKMSKLDAWGQTNYLTGKISQLAKSLYNAHSQYRIESSVKVEGSAMSPFYKCELDVIPA